MKAVIISDLHLGSTHMMCDDFLKFLDGLSDGRTLILNGDTIDRWRTNLTRSHKFVLTRIRQESLKRKVVWIYGNHDELYVMDKPANILFRPSYNIGEKIFITHGHNFEKVMNFNRGFIWLFYAIHKIRIALGAESIHVAHLAKRFPRLYRVLCDKIANNAIEYAKENGYEVIVCGHSHKADDYIKDGVRYINTGAWTEHPICYVYIDEEAIVLTRYANNSQ